MVDKKKALLIVLAIAVLLPVFVQTADAKPYQEIKGNQRITYGQDYVKYENLDSLLTSARTDILPYKKLYDYSDWQYDYYVNYKLFQNASIVKLETFGSGSYIFNKNTCTYDLYDGGKIINGVVPYVKDITYTVKGKAANATTWTSINSVNNAACSVSVQTTENSVKLTGTKTAAAGTFQIELNHKAGKGIKETLRAYNNNPAWTNHNVGFTQTITVPKIIKFGNTYYDLSQYNNTSFGRTWIENNQAKLIKMSNNLFYDFGIGYDNLYDVKVIWDGTKAKLIMNYLYYNTIVPYQQWVEVDPIFSTGDFQDGSVYGGPAAASANCGATFGVNNTNSRILKRASGDGASADTCQGAYVRYNVASIPDGADITFAKLNYTQSWNSGTPQSCTWVYLSLTGGPQGNQATYDNIVLRTGSNFTYINRTDTTCVSNGVNNIYFNQTAWDLFERDIRAGGDNKIDIGWFFNSLVRPAALVLTDDNRLETSALTLYWSVTYPNAVTSLTVGNVTVGGADLAWTAPALNGGTLSGYRINYTTPYGAPTSVLVSNTGSATTRYTISTLNEATPYSVRVSAILSTGVGNITSAAIANFTTVDTGSADYTIGSFDFNATNTDTVDITFLEIESSPMVTRLNVTYPRSWSSPTCDFSYVTAGTNQTYSLAGNIISSTQKRQQFTFYNSSNDIINAYCQNTADRTQNGRYTMTQTFGSIPILDLIANFRNGEYGTAGMFGAIDLVTLIALILSMIGFNRVNESVGIVFSIVMMGFLSYFEVVQWYVIMSAAISLVALVTLFSTRKQ